MSDLRAASVLLVVASALVPSPGSEIRAADTAVRVGAVESEAPTLAALGRAMLALPPGARVDDGLFRLIGDPSLDSETPAHFVERFDADPSQGGIEVEYTTDPTLDVIVRDVFERQRVSLGHAILMDPSSGEVFSFVSTAPDRFPATRAYPAASLMKVITAAAVFRNAPEATERGCRYLGSPYHVGPEQLDPPTGVGRWEPFRHALAISNNQCFARLAVHDVGQQALIDEMERVGIFEVPGARHAPGRVESIESALDLGYLGSGLRGAFLTPLAAVRLAAVLAEGRLVTPYWVARARDDRGLHIPIRPRAPSRPAWPAEIATRLREWMVDVTAKGTAHRAFAGPQGAPRLGPIRVAAKTGTLSGTNPPGLYQWFIGVAPAEAPRVAIAIAIVDAEPAGRHASDVAAATLEALFCHDGECRPDRIARLQRRARERDRVASGEERVALLSALHEIPVEPLASDELAALRETFEIDRAPRPLGETKIDFPPRLLRRRTRGEIVVRLELDSAGEVREARVDSSDLPDFEPVVLSQVREWRFTPATHDGEPIAAVARLPIPIRIN